VIIVLEWEFVCSLQWGFMKKTKKSRSAKRDGLSLRGEAIRMLSGSELPAVAGGMMCPASSCDMGMPSTVATRDSEA
jgi:hypothetical protein